MRVTSDGTTVTITMTPAEAADIENKLLWDNLDGEPAAESLWEGLSRLHDGE